MTPYDAHLTRITAHLDVLAEVHGAYLYLRQAFAQLGAGHPPRAIASFLTYSPDVQCAAMTYYAVRHHADLVDLRERLGVGAYLTDDGARAFRAERHAILARPRGVEPMPCVVKAIAQTRAMGWDKGKWVG